jgi:hypothetical protein
MKNPLFDMKPVITGSYKAIVGAGSGAGAGAGAESNSFGSATLPTPYYGTLVLKYLVQIRVQIKWRIRAPFFIDWIPLIGKKWQFCNLFSCFLAGVLCLW